MKPHRLWLALILLSALTVQAGSPEDAAAWLKKTIAPVFSEDGDVSLKAREKIEKSDVAPELKKLIAKDNAEIEKTGEVGKLGFDWVLNAQDTPTGWEMKTPIADGEEVIVPVATKWSDGSRVHFFYLKPAGKGWQIADVWYPGSEATLVGILK